MGSGQSIATVEAAKSSATAASPATRRKKSFSRSAGSTRGGLLRAVAGDQELGGGRFVHAQCQRAFHHREGGDERELPQLGRERPPAGELLVDPPDQRGEQECFEGARGGGAAHGIDAIHHVSRGLEPSSPASGIIEMMV